MRERVATLSRLRTVSDACVSRALGEPDGVKLREDGRSEKPRPAKSGLTRSGGMRAACSYADLNHPNRRMRTRLSGGVGGEEPQGSPLSRLRPAWARPW